MISAQIHRWFKTAFGILAAFTALAALFMAAVAFGAPASQPPAGAPVGAASSANAVAHDALDLLLKLVGLAATIAIPLLIKKWLGAKVSTETLAQLTTLAEQGMNVAEEAGHQRGKEGRMKLTPSEKTEIATTYVTTTADNIGLAGVTAAAVTDMIKSALGATRRN